MHLFASETLPREAIPTPTPSEINPLPHNCRSPQWGWAYGNFLELHQVIMHCSAYNFSELSYRVSTVSRGHDAWAFFCIDWI